MKFLSVLLVALLCSTAAVIVYAHAFQPTPSSPSEAHLTGDRDVSDLEARIARLEAADRPMLAGEAPPAVNIDAMQELLARVDALERARSTSPPNAAESPETPAPVTNEPTEAEIERHAELDRAVRERAAAKKRARWLEGVLSKADLDLTADQQQRVGKAFEAFRARRDEIWQEVKTSAANEPQQNWRQIIEDTQVRIRREFAETLRPIVPRHDPEAVATALLGAGK